MNMTGVLADRNLFGDAGHVHDLTPYRSLR